MALTFLCLQERADCGTVVSFSVLYIIHTNIPDLPYNTVHLQALVNSVDISKRAPCTVKAGYYINHKEPPAAL